MKKAKKPKEPSFEDYPYGMVLVGANGAIELGYCKTSDQAHVDYPTATAAEIQEWWYRQPAYKEPKRKKKK